MRLSPEKQGRPAVGARSTEREACMTVKHPSSSTRRRLVSVASILGLVAASAFASGVPANASGTQLSNSTGRFLSGVAGGTSLDTIAAIEGEGASYPDNPGANQNSLNASLLGQAIPLAF